MKSLFDLVKDQRRQDFADESPDFDSTATEPDGSGEEHGFSLQLKKKRRTVMLKRMLSDAGYNDLAKMINVKEY